MQTALWHLQTLVLDECMDIHEPLYKVLSNVTERPVHKLEDEHYINRTITSSRTFFEIGSQQLEARNRLFEVRYVRTIRRLSDVWENLKRRIQSCIPAPTNIKELKTTVVEEWESIPQREMLGIMNGLSHRLHEAIRPRRGNTYY